MSIVKRYLLGPEKINDTKLCVICVFHVAFESFLGRPSFSRGLQTEP